MQKTAIGGIDLGIPIANEFFRYFRDRRCLLWVCQRNDLLASEEPHGYSTPPSDALLKYREHPNDTDSQIASLYWEAIWLEGAMSPLLVALRKQAEVGTSEEHRQVVTLSGPSDAHARVSSQVFLPVFVLPGRLDDAASADAKYGVLKERQRERVAFELASRLAEFRSRLLVVVGAEVEGDLQRLFEVLEDSNLTDLRVLISWPSSNPIAEIPQVPGVEVEVWNGSTDNLAIDLKTMKAPGALDLPRWGIRLDSTAVEIRAKDLERIKRRFALIHTQDLAAVDSFDIEDLQAFLDGDLTNWRAYAEGLPVPRSYTISGNPLAQTVVDMLDSLRKSKEKSQVLVYTLPCRSGSGATTLMRSAAYAAAKEGYPVLILKPEQVDMDFEDIEAFLISLSDAASKYQLDGLPPVLIVIDTEHFTMQQEIRQLPQFLDTHSRRALILRVVPSSSEKLNKPRPRRFPELTATATEEEIESCQSTFTRLAKTWSLPLDPPSLADWMRYKEATSKWTSPDRSEESSDFDFWLALRFFLLEGLDQSASERAGKSLSQWIQRRIDNVDSPVVKEIIDNVAVLSSFQLVSPMWTVLRPVTGGTFPSSFSDSLKTFDSIIAWGVDSENDQVLRFKHVEMAKDYLRLQGVESIEQRFVLLEPLIIQLSQGQGGDVWVAQALAVRVLSPRFGEPGVDWELRLRIFDMFPPLLRDQNKTILHHWARCLYRSVDNLARCSDIGLDEEDCRARYLQAIDKLKSAIKLPQTRSSDEQPSNLYNTLGTAFFRYARFIEETRGNPTEAEDAWGNACEAFEESIKLSKGTNVEALLAFSHRLLNHRQSVEPEGEGSARERSVQHVNEVLQALDLLDKTEVAIDALVNPEYSWKDQLKSYRATAYHYLDENVSAQYIQELKDSDDPELGYLCEARLACEDIHDQKCIKRGLDVFASAAKNRVVLHSRSIVYWLDLLRRHDGSRFEFDQQWNLYQLLRRQVSYDYRPVDLFRHAVLGYQTGHFQEADELFRKLREETRLVGNIGYGLKDIWRDSANPSRPRVTSVRITKLTTEWRAMGFVEDINQTIPLRPRHFQPQPKVGEQTECIIQFGSFGPLAVPEHFGTKRSRDAT